MSYLFPIVALLFLCVAAPGETVIFPRGSLWKYSESTPPTNWTQLGFNDSSWAVDEAQFGYGESDEAALLTANGNPVYFRKSFTIANLSNIHSLALRLVADDGAAVYLNGTEVVRRNLPSGPITPTTTALRNIEVDENVFRLFAIPTNQLLAGLNVLAVELRQHPSGRHDASFDAELLTGISVAPPGVTLLSPTNGAQLAAGSVRLNFEAFDPTGDIVSFNVFANDIMIATALVPPYELTWTPPTPGRYTIVAQCANDQGGFFESAAVKISYGVTTPASLKHEPYLQSCTTTSIVIRWNTDWFTNAVVRYGIAPSALTFAETNLALATAHEFRITGLNPATRYYYSAGTVDGTFAESDEHRFQTAPTSSVPTRIWVVGDSGTRNGNAETVRDAYYESAGRGTTDLMLMLGDNSYGAGLMDDYELDVFKMYEHLLKQTPVWPTLGNHDGGDSRPARMSGYANSFSLPVNGEAGGTPSGTEIYYSFDHANIHFICLDSHGSTRSPGSAMLRWLEDDLMSTAKDWIIAFWHHPPYTKGTHDSDLEIDLIEMRQFVLPMLEAYGVDLVLCGHSHAYERSYFLNGHYGSSSTLQPGMILDQRSGNPAVGGPYRKPAGGLGANQGTVYAVCGCSGEGGLGTFSRTHPAMITSLGGYGSMSLEVDQLVLTAKFIRPSGDIDDLFVIDKSAPSAVEPRLDLGDAKTPLLSWPTSLPAFSLEQSSNPGAAGWSPFLGTISTRGRQYIAQPDTNAPHQFFRLRAEPIP